MELPKYIIFSLIFGSFAMIVLESFFLFSISELFQSGTGVPYGLVVWGDFEILPFEAFWGQIYEGMGAGVRGRSYLLWEGIRDHLDLGRLDGNDLKICQNNGAALILRCFNCLWKLLAPKFEIFWFPYNYKTNFRLNLCAKAPIVRSSNFASSSSNNTQTGNSSPDAISLQFYPGNNTIFYYHHRHFLTLRKITFLNDMSTLLRMQHLCIRHIIIFLHTTETK